MRRWWAAEQSRAMQHVHAARPQHEEARRCSLRVMLSTLVVCMQLAACLLGKADGKVVEESVFLPTYTSSALPGSQTSISYSHALLRMQRCTCR